MLLGRTSNASHEQGNGLRGGTALPKKTFGHRAEFSEHLVSVTLCPLGL